MPWSLRSTAGALDGFAQGRRDDSVGEERKRKRGGLPFAKFARGKAAPLSPRGEEGLWLGRDEVAATILLPAGFVGFPAERLFLAKADSVEIGGRNAEVHEILFDGIGTAIAESEVVLGGAAFVTMAFDIDLGVRIAFEEGSGLFEGLASVRPDVRLV